MANSYDGTVALSHCTFQLESLSWGCLSVSDSGSFERFILAHGAHLRHFDLGPNFNVSNNFQWLPPDACHTLASVCCDFVDLPHITNTRNLTALKIFSSAHFAFASPHIGINSSAAATVQYLSIDLYFPCDAFGNLILLEVLIWSTEVCSNFHDSIPFASSTFQMQTISALCHLPNLRTLVLHEENDFWPMPDLTRDSQVREQVIAESCERCPKLMYIIHDLTYHEDAGEHHYTKFSISRDQNHGSGSPLRVYRKDVTAFRASFLRGGIFMIQLDC